MRDSVHIDYPESQAFMRVAEVLQGRLVSVLQRSAREVASRVGQPGYGVHACENQRLPGPDAATTPCVPARRQVSRRGTGD